MTTKTKTTKAAAEATGERCAYADCCAPLPGPYGTPGVSLSRADGQTFICSGCGTREALNRNLLGTRFRGFERRGVG